MKKIASLILTAAMAVSLAACGGSSSTASSSTAASTASTAETTAAATTDAAATDESEEELAGVTDATATSITPLDSATVNPDGTKWTMKFSHCMGTTSGYQAYAEKFKELVEMGSNGDITIDIYPASQLGGERESNEAAQLGTIDFSYTSAAPLATFASGFDVYNLPFLFESREHAHAYFDSADGDARLAELEDSGLIGLAWAEVDFFNLFLTEPVETPDDMNGLTIRCLENTFYMTYLSMMGANPVPMAWSEVPAGMTNGTIQGACLGIAGAYDLSMFEGNYYMEGDITWGPCPVVMSKIVYDQLPEAYQQLIRTAAKEAVTYQREWYAENLPKMEQEMIDGGTTVVQIDRDAFIEKAVKPVYDKMIEDGLVDPEDITKINSYRTTEPNYVPE